MFDIFFADLQSAATCSDNPPVSKILFTLHRSGVSRCVWAILIGWRVRSTLHHSSPQIFSLAVYRLRGDCKSPGFIGRTFFYSGLQIRWDASRKTDAWRKIKYPGEEWVKSGEELSQLFTSRNPSVYRDFRRFGEGWRVKKRVGIFSLPTYRFVPGNGTILPW